MLPRIKVFFCATGSLSYCKTFLSHTGTCYCSVGLRLAAGNVCFMFQMLVRALFTQCNLGEENHTYTQ